MEAHINNLKLYSLSEAAKLLGIGRDTLKSLITKGKIGYLDFFKHKKISHLELERFIKESTMKTENTAVAFTSATDKDVEHFLNGSKRKNNFSTNTIFDSVYKEKIDGKHLR